MTESKNIKINVLWSWKKRFFTRIQKHNASLMSCFLITKVSSCKCHSLLPFLSPFMHKLKQIAISKYLLHLSHRYVTWLAGSTFPPLRFLCFMMQSRVSSLLMWGLSMSYYSAKTRLRTSSAELLLSSGRACGQGERKASQRAASHWLFSWNYCKISQSLLEHPLRFHSCWSEKCHLDQHSKRYRC